MLAKLGNSVEAVERFKREARASSRIPSDHVVRVIDADRAPELGGAPFFVMELLEGADLHRVTAERLPSPAEVVEWLRQIARALTKAHDLGIVHRDLKPENLFLTHREDGTPCVKILDFGIAKVTDEGGPRTQTGQILGTPTFMAPEQAGSSAGKVTPKTDLFALGLIAFRLLVGHDYWIDGDIVKLIAQIVVEPMEAPSLRGSRFGTTFDDWFLRACSRAAEARFANASEQVEALAAALGLPVKAAAPSASGQSFTASSDDEFATSPTLDAAATADSALAPTLEQSTEQEPPPRIAGDVARASGTPELLPIADPTIDDNARATETTTSAAHANHAPATARTPSRGGKRLVWLSVPVALLALVVGLLGRGRPTSSTVSSSATPSAMPPERPTLPAAVAEYETGLDSLRHRAVSGARAHFEKTVELEPGFLPARVQLLIGYLAPGPRFMSRDLALGRAQFAEVQRHATKLSARDRSLVEAYEALARAEPDTHVFRERMEKVARSYPSDADVLFWTAGAEYLDNDAAAGLATSTNVLALDPSYGPAYMVLYDSATARGDAAGSEAALRNCTKHAPYCAFCRNTRAQTLIASGRCDELKSASKDWAAVDPESIGAHTTYAMALFAMRQPLPAVREQVAEVRRLDPRNQLLDVVMLDAFEGDFAKVAKSLSDDLARSAQSDTDFAAAVAFVDVQSERPNEEATANIQNWIDRLVAWERPDRKLTDAFLKVERAHRGAAAGTLSRAAFERIRDDTVAALTPEDLIQYSDDGLYTLASSRLAVRFDHRPLSSVDASQLLAAAGTESQPGLDELLATAHTSLGHADKVLELLQRPARHCATPLHSVPFVREHLWLGMAFERKKALEEAKKSYSFVVDHWGKAVPPSLSAQIARKRLEALGSK